VPYLLYSQDPGGGNLLSIVAQRLAKNFSKDSGLVLVHPLSERVFKKRGAAIVQINEIFPHLPITSRDWEEYLSSSKISHAICSISSPHGDFSNGWLIQACRKLGVPTLGFFDHWVGFDRFWGENNSLESAPDIVACIDMVSKKSLGEVGLPLSRIYPVGHAHLEQIEKLHKKRKKREELRIVLVSQPIAIDKSFRGIFGLEVDNCRLVDHIVQSISRIFREENYRIRYRPHPKEIGQLNLPKMVELDSSTFDEEIILDNDIFIGINSMLLLEANLVGCQCIRLSIPEVFEVVPYVPIPIYTGREIIRIHELGDVFKEVVLDISRESKNKPSPVFSGSLNQTMRLIQNFLWDCLR